MTAARLSVEIPRDYWLTANRTVVTPPAARDLIATVVEAITGEEVMAA